MASALEVSPVRLIFNVDSISAVSVRNNFMYLTSQRTSVSRINLDEPSHVLEIGIPKRLVSVCGYITFLQASQDGKVLYCITSKKEHFFYFENSHSNSNEFRYISKLKGVNVTCADFHPEKNTCILLGTDTGQILEIDVSHVNDAYFKRDLKYQRQVFLAKIKSKICDIHIFNSKKVAIICDKQILLFESENNKNEGNGDSVFKAVFSSTCTLLLESNTELSNLRVSPDSKTLACLCGDKVMFCRKPGLNFNRVSVPDGIKFMMISNYYFLLLTSSSSGTLLMAINIFDNRSAFYEPIPNIKIIGISQDNHESTYWLYSSDEILEAKILNEANGMWRILSSQHRFEEALDITSTHAARSFILQQYGFHVLQTDPKKGANLLGLSDIKLDIACFHVLRVSKSVLSCLLLARLQRTKSKAQQILLTSWLVELGEYSVIDSKYAVDFKTLQQIFLRKGLFEMYLKISAHNGDIEACVQYYISNSRLLNALETLQKHPQLSLLYKYSMVLMKKCPKETIECFMQIPNLNVEHLLPNLISYSCAYRGPLEENQALFYLLKCIELQNNEYHQHKYDVPPLFNTIVTLISMRDGGNDERLLHFLKQHSGDYHDLYFALRTCLTCKQIQSSVYLYTLMGLSEEAVLFCLSIGEIKMFEQAVAIADEQGTVNDELRRYLLKLIAHKVILTQGPQQASKFVGLLRVENLLYNFPDFEMLNELTADIVGNLEQMNTSLSALNLEIDETLKASETMQQELRTCTKHSVLMDEGERCLLCLYPLPSRGFVVFPCQHGFHHDCAQKHKANEIADICLICNENTIMQVDVPLSSTF